MFPALITHVFDSKFVALFSCKYNCKREGCIFVVIILNFVKQFFIVNVKFIKTCYFL